MNAKLLTDMSTDELSQKLKSLKNSKITEAALIGFTIGVVVYSVTTHGLSFPSLFPLLVLYLVYRNSKNTEALRKEVEVELEKRSRQ
ncbi:hypothetical protein [Sphingobacterium deserti]|nr:hypothetical protein [Sphingobacterium deserti]